MLVISHEKNIILKDKRAKAVTGRKHSTIQFDPYENQWRIQVANNPNISATSYASMNTKAIGRKSPKAEYVPAFTFQDYTSGR